ncbi:MAG: hypothetical protein H7318_13245 [Oligoflexus sp.]|nr:hypothetical protein [Oligoflexus sp.]
MRGVFNLGLSLTLTTLATVGYSHGEDKLGPHKGFVRMPGSFHTEVVNNGTLGFKVYLLDLNWENATTQDSSAKLTLVSKNKTLHTTMCSARNDVFICPVQFEGDIKDAVKLELETTRMGIKGVKMDYDLPLKLQ